MARVLVTRAMPEAEDTAAMLRAGGHAPVLLPLRRVEELPVTWPDEAPDALIATSRNAFRFALPEAWRALPVFCVGGQTGEAARGAGFRTVQTADGDAGRLALDILARAPANWRLVYLAGEPRRDELEMRLGAAQRSLAVIIRYRLVPNELSEEAVKQALQASESVLHFSAQSARAFADLVRRFGLDGAARALDHVCISPAVARALLAAFGPVPNVRIAPSPDGASMLALIPA
jgi:uroporphyrinogen-III synthase